MTTYEQFLNRTVLLESGCRRPVYLRKMKGRAGFLPLTWDGYTQVNVNGRVARTHRVAWELANGPVPPKMTLDHTCRNRWCCEIDHLEVVTNAENVRRGDLPELSKGLMSQLNAARRICLECGMESTPAGITKHQRVQNHNGWILADPSREE